MAIAGRRLEKRQEVEDDVGGNKYGDRNVPGRWNALKCHALYPCIAHYVRLLVRTLFRALGATAGAHRPRGRCRFGYHQKCKRSRCHPTLVPVFVSVRMG